MKKNLIAGTMRWGTWGAKMTTEQYGNAISKWMECGVNEFDLANLYGDYTCEKEFGDALKYSQISRSSVTLISKMGIETPSAARNNSVKHYNYFKENIVSCVEQSLRSLQTDYLDVLLLHRPSPLIEVNEVSEVINTLISAGKIKSFGVSNFLPEQLNWLSNQLKIEHNQISFSLANYSAMENGCLEAFASQNLHVSAYSPIVNAMESSEELRNVLNVFSEKYNVSEAAICVAWVLKHPLVYSAVIGTSRIDRISEIQKALEVELDLQDYFKLWEAARGSQVP
jgi:predicted oxidoreductase